MFTAEEINSIDNSIKKVMFGLEQRISKVKSPEKMKFEEVALLNEQAELVKNLLEIKTRSILSNKQ